MSSSKGQGSTCVDKREWRRTGYLLQGMLRLAWGEVRVSGCGS